MTNELELFLTLLGIGLSIGLVYTIFGAYSSIEQEVDGIVGYERVCWCIGQSIVMAGVTFPTLLFAFDAVTGLNTVHAFNEESATWRTGLMFGVMLMLMVAWTIFFLKILEKIVRRKRPDVKFEPILCRA